jgi:hypothetical protein
MTMSVQGQILPDLSQGVEGLAAELRRLKAENAKLREENSKKGPFGLKVTEKGGVSVYGMGRFPVTLYREQWERLLAKKEEILKFLDDNASKLSTKGE